MDTPPRLSNWLYTKMPDTEYMLSSMAVDTAIEPIHSWKIDPVPWTGKSGILCGPRDSLPRSAIPLWTIVLKVQSSGGDDWVAA